MSWKDLYSEVKKRKMQALNKGNVVKAVEEHGKVLCINGRFEKPKKIIKNLYAAKKKIIDPSDVLKHDLNKYDLVIVGCPGDQILPAALLRLKQYVIQGGWVLTTDWCIKFVIETMFPGYIRWNRERTDDAVVACQILEPNHPFLDGVLREIRQEKWSKAQNIKKDEFRWWLERKSFPIQNLDPKRVSVLISSRELGQKWGDSPILCFFNYGKNGGRVIHMISHTHLQKGEMKGKYASALILSNIIDEKISQKLNISKPQPPHYVDYSALEPQAHHSQERLDDPWLNVAPENEYLTPATSQGGVNLTATSQIVEANDTNFSFSSQCAYCGHDFIDFKGKIYLCKECGAPYHDKCLNVQINEGTCKNCNRILLW